VSQNVDKPHKTDQQLSMRVSKRERERNGERERERERGERE
jgi:hypothetical protein